MADIGRNAVQAEAYNEILKPQNVVSTGMLKNHITLNNIHPATLLQMGEHQVRKRSILKRLPRTSVNHTEPI